MASKKLNGRRRSFTEEFKAGAVRLVLQEGRTVAEMARDLDLWESVLHQWVKQAKVAGGKGPLDALTSSEKDELAKLRRENRLSKHERDILISPRPSSRRRTREVRVRRRGEGETVRGRFVSRPAGVQERLLRVEAAA